MQIAEILKLVENGVLSPEAEIGVDVGFPPLKVTIKVKVSELKKLLLDTGTVTDVVQRCFNQRRIFHPTVPNEDPAICTKSAIEIVAALRTAQSDLPKVGANTALVALLKQWENFSVSARQDLEDRGDLYEILTRYRAQTLPIVEALIAMLPVVDPTRVEAEVHVETTRSLISGPDNAQISDAWHLVPAEI